ncbi:MAG: hypothetical protein JSW11_20735 [Candidatus Heimdallarchaeota archaeon]|nr:MAG: hypothetical protein JSW11_20735 [Candidatus Heimdallarchaeota archaeon]
MRSIEIIGEVTKNICWINSFEKIFKDSNHIDLDLTMRSDMFNFPVEIIKLDWPFNSNFDENEIHQLLTEFRGFLKPRSKEDRYTFYEFTRTGLGLSRPTIVLFLPSKGHFSIKAFAYPPPITLSLKKPPVNLANYHRMRVQHLMHSLEEHFPETHILESKSGNMLIIFQEFLFHPICQFNTPQQINQLIEILWLASRARILLDYNQSNWLVSGLEFLYYVDTDYIGHSYIDLDRCLLENLNQSMAFFTPENVKLLPQALKDFSELSETHTKFVTRFKKVLQKIIESWDQDKLSEENKQKYDIFTEITQP